MGALAEVVEGAGVREERRVSWMPGAEGAPLEVLEEVLVVEVAWEDGGAMRRDCVHRVSILQSECCTS